MQVKTKNANPSKRKNNNLKLRVISFEALNFYLLQTNRGRKLGLKI